MSDDEQRCRFATKCPMFPLFSSQLTLRIFQIHYCQSQNHSECERYKRAVRGEMPPPTLLPDGTHLANRPGNKKPST